MTDEQKVTSESGASLVGQALEQPRIEWHEDTLELLNSSVKIFDRWVEELATSMPPIEPDSCGMLGLAVLSVHPWSEEGTRQQGYNCRECGARTSRPQEFLHRLASQSRWAEFSLRKQGLLDVAVSQVNLDGSIQLAIDVVASSLQFAIEGLMVIGTDLATEASSRGCGPVSFDVGFRGDSYRL